MEMPICMIICHRASTCVLRRGHMQVLKGCSMWAMLQNKTFAGGFNTAAHCMLSDQITVTAKYKTEHISKVEKPSSRGMSSLHRWSLMLLPVLWPMPLCALCTHVCVSTTLCLLSFGSPPHCCSLVGRSENEEIIWCSMVQSSFCYIWRSNNTHNKCIECLKL